MATSTSSSAPDNQAELQALLSKQGNLLGYPFTFDRLLGSGTEGAVFLTSVELSPSSVRRLAVKIPHPGQEFDRDFGREAEVLGKRSESLYALIADGPHPITLPNGTESRALLMPVMDGGSLEGERQQRSSDGKQFDSNETAGVMAQLVLAIREAGVAHGDIKPDNVLIDRHGGMHLTDWGLATPYGERPKQVWGTPRFMAPETVKEVPADEKADLFAIAYVGYELNTRRPARVFPENADGMQVLDTIANQQRKLRCRDPLLTTVLREATRHNTTVRSDSADMLLDLAAFPAAREHYGPDEYATITERLVQRRHDHPERSPDLDAAAMRGLLSDWRGSPAHRQIVASALEHYDEGLRQAARGVRPPTRLDELLSAWEVQELGRGQPVFLADDLRGAALRLAPDERAQLTPAIAGDHAASWRSVAGDERSQTEAQPQLDRVRALVPHLNRRSAAEVAEVLADDWEVFRHALNQDQHHLYVRIRNADDTVEQGMIARSGQTFERNGLWVVHRNDQALVRTEEYQDGVLHGRRRLLDEQGALRRVEQYQHGQLHGEQVDYGHDGRQQVVTEYDCGQRVDPGPRRTTSFGITR